MVKKVPMNAVAVVVESVLRLKIHKATKYLSPTLVVRATAPLLHGKRHMDTKSVVLTIGKPNFLERKFIKLCIKAKEPFPVKRVVLKWPPISRVKNAKKARK